ncbi:MAG: hypothetical protein KBF68_02650 [Nitrosomonas sp.]|nr:hypothetical protein [Nitrosomonas sp.]
MNKKQFVLNKGIRQPAARSRIERSSPFPYSGKEIKNLFLRIAGSFRAGLVSHRMP